MEIISTGYAHNTLMISRYLRYSGGNGVNTRKKRFVNLFKICIHFITQYGTDAFSFDLKDSISEVGMEEEVTR